MRKPVPVGEIPAPRAPSLEDEQVGHQTFGELTEQYKLDYDHPRYNELQEVVQRLTTAVNANVHPWHVYLLKDAKTKNAGATRGNHIYVWSGMLDYTKNTDELAAILSHEISHVLSGHTDPDPNEQMRKLFITVGAMAAGIAAAQVSGYGDVGRITSQATNSIGEGLFLNPYSQANENEADQVGIFLMAKAGYNPEAAVRFWERAAQDPSFNSGPSFFSTHPSSSERMTRLQQLLPKALDTYTGKRTTPVINYQENLQKITPKVNNTPPRGDSGVRDSWDIRDAGQP